MSGSSRRRSRSSPSNRRCISGADFERRAGPLRLLARRLHISDPTELPYRNLRKGIRLNPLGPPRV